MSAIDTIKERLARSMGQEPIPAAPTPGVPGVPAPQAQAPQPAPVVPEAVKPAIDPDILKSLESAKAQAELRVKELEAEVARANADREAFTKQQAEAMKLPSAEELGRMDQGEALQKVVQAMTARQDAALRSLATDLNQRHVQPTQQALKGLLLQQKRDIASEVYGKDVMEKYRSAFDEKSEQYPDITPCEVLRMVADPADLSQDARPMTPSIAHSAVAASMAAGMATRSGAPAAPPPAQGSPTTQAFLEASHALRSQGDRFGSDSARREGLKMRLQAQGALPQG